MPLTRVGQNQIGLGSAGPDACGAACVCSVICSLTGHMPDAATVFRKICTTRLTSGLGSTPHGIANYLIAQGRTVVYQSPSSHTPITSALQVGLKLSKAKRNSTVTAPGGPTYTIHLLKKHGLLKTQGHFIVGDGHGHYMDPAPSGGHIRTDIPPGYYDTGLTLTVS